jgi:hypothetical protein
MFARLPASPPASTCCLVKFDLRVGDKPVPVAGINFYKGLMRTVSIPRRHVPFVPRITPNYVMRNLPAMPHFSGTWVLPTVDNLLSYGFDPREFVFA